MGKLSRREARELLVGLLFETEFKADEDTNGIFMLAVEDRELPNDDYVRRAYFGIYENLAEIDACISRHSDAWRPERMARLSRSILRMCVYEMLYEEIPYTVSINEAIEVCKKYDDEKARPLINGILNSVKKELEAK